MYCTKCKNKLEPSDKYCTTCGTKISNYNNDDSNNLKVLSIILGITSIILSFTIIPSFISSLAGFIIAIISKKENKNNIGIILNVIGFIFTIIFTIFFALIIFNIIDNEYDYEYYPIEDDRWDYVIPFSKSNELDIY